MATGNTSTKNKVINLANVEFTENGTYIPNKGVTGFGKVTVTVPPDAMKKPLYITPTATNVLNEISWDEYTGPYLDKYVKAIGYKKENRNVFDFSNTFIGRMNPDGTIVNSFDDVIGKVSSCLVVYNENNEIIGYVDAKGNAFNFEDTKIGKLDNDGNIVDDEQVIIGKSATNVYLAYNNTEIEYVGVRDIQVRKVGSWIDSNISADNIRKGQNILGVAGEVIELNGEERTVNSSTSTQTILPSNGKNAITKVTVNPYTLQTGKTVQPAFNRHTYYADSGYNGLGNLTVDPINVQIIVDEEPNLKPENIKKNVRLFGGQITGTYDNYPPLTTVSISPKITPQTITPPSGFDGFTKASVDPVTHDIDPNIKPENIRKGATILGVEGVFKAGNLQDKTVDPQPHQTTVECDTDTPEEYVGLNSVTINAVTSGIDSNIQAGNIKKDVTILGVTGNYDPQPIIQAPVTVDPSTLQQSVTPDAGYDGLGRVNINAVTASIDPNILAENIKKNIDILGVTGTYDPKPNYQEEKIVQPITAGDIQVTADPTYDALLKVIVKAVTASIDPNILPKNIRKNVSILGVLGTMEEGGGQKWFDFSGLQNFVELNQDAWSEGGNESIRITGNSTDYELETFINETFPSIGNINAIMFKEVYGYDDEEITDDIVEECYINFIGGNLYMEYSKLTIIEDQKRYFYPLINDYGVKGLTIGLDNDDGSARTMKLYVLTDSSKKYNPVPVLVNGNMTVGLLPPEYNDFRFVKDIQIPAHDVYIPKTKSMDNKQWVLRDVDGVRTRLVDTLGQPDIIEVSAYDRDYGELDNEINIHGGWKLKDYNKLLIDPVTALCTQSISGESGYIRIPGNVEKQNGYYYYIKFDPGKISGNSTYYTLAYCNSMFAVYLYRYSTYDHYYIGWRNNWSSSSSGSNTYYSRNMYPGNTYYIRIYVTGTTARLDFSTDGITWTNNINTVSNGYINSTNTNPIYFYSSAGPNTKLYADGFYITDSNGNKVYTPLEEILIKKTSHEIVNRDNENLLVTRDTSRYSVKYQGDERYQISSFNPSTALLDMGINGNIEIQNGFYVNNKTWEICQHFKLTSIIGSNNRHLASWSANSSNTRRRNVLWIDTGNCVCWRIYYNSSGSAIVDGRLNNTSLTVGTDYYIKYGWNGSTYYMYLSTSPNFNSYVTSWTTNSTSITYCDTSKLLIGNWTYNAANGSMRYLYLDDYTYVKVNGEIIWKPKHEELYGNIVDYIDDGSSVTLDAYLVISGEHNVLTNADLTGDVYINNNNELSNFTNYNYMKIDNFNVGTNSWKIHTKIKTGSMDSSERYIFGQPSINQTTPQLAIQNSVLRIWLSSDKSSWNIANGVSSTLTLSDNTQYDIDCYFDGTQYKVDVNGTNYITISSSVSIYSDGSPICFGYDNGNSPFNGSIYLSNTQIEIDNTLWWEPIFKTIYDYDWIFTKNDNWSFSGLTNLGKKGTLVVPEHHIHEWNQEEMEWSGLKQLTFNLNDETAILYTEITEH